MKTCREKFLTSFATKLCFFISSSNLTPALECSLSWKCLRRCASLTIRFLVYFQSLHMLCCSFSSQSRSGYSVIKGKPWKNRDGSWVTSSSYRYSTYCNTEGKCFQFDFLCNNNKVRFIHITLQTYFFYLHLLIFLFTYPLFQPNWPFAFLPLCLCKKYFQKLFSHLIL